MEKVEAIGTLSALAQENRLDIFRLLVEAGTIGMAAGRIGDELGMASATLSFHLKEMKNAGIVTCRKEGRSVIYGANFTAMNELIGYLLENCCRRSEKRRRGSAAGHRSAPASSRTSRSG
ncbi:MAG: metalloregulator ArsR/SmtB family transcription factor [Proteobacteria bacterium]|nr:metalloregulator ArsR/SmtB family transcription factor [Pseudomonadota bacterium]